MPILLEGDCNFTQDEKDFLAFCSSPEFPWYHVGATENFSCLTHYLWETTTEPTRGVQRSYYAPDAEKIFQRICAENGITVRTLYRMSFNLTFSDPSKHGDPHQDHWNFKHNVMLIYLNDFDDGFTFLLDEAGKKVVDKIIPAKNKFSIFDGGVHAQGFCRPQQYRLVLVATFDGDVPVKVEAAA